MENHNSVRITDQTDSKLIKAPAKCESCGLVYQSPTTGTVSNRCICGGELKPVNPVVLLCQECESRKSQISEAQKGLKRAQEQCDGLLKENKELRDALLVHSNTLRTQLEDASRRLANEQLDHKQTCEQLCDTRTKYRHQRFEVKEARRQNLDLNAQLAAAEKDKERLLGALSSAFSYAQVGSYRGPSNEAWVSMKIEVEQILAAAEKAKQS